jgi:hypothetical protein
MIITDIQGHKLNWTDHEIIPIRLKLIIGSGQIRSHKDPLATFLDKINYDYNSFFDKAKKITIKECKMLKRRLNGIIKKWHMCKIKKQIIELVELLQRCINNRRCLYIYTNKELLKLVS